MEESNLFVHTIPYGPISTNAYLIVDLKNKQSVIVDAPPGIAELIHSLLTENHVALKAIFLTHGHWDHMADAARLASAYNIPVYAHKGDGELFSTPRVMASMLPDGVALDPVDIQHWVEHGDKIDMIGESFEVRHVPGHSPGSVLFYHERLGAFSGDALFQGSVGRTDLPGGNFATLRQSIRNHIYSLPGSTRVYPGHGEPTTVEEEALNNPYVKRAGL